MTNPYRIPPTTGPTTRRQKLRARVQVRLEGLAKPVGRAIGPAIIVSMLVGLTALICHDVRTSPKPRWLVECPDREPWETDYAHDRSNGRVVAHDPQDREVILPMNCAVTRVQ